MGVTVIDRPAEISGDEAPSESALLHALKFLLERDGRDPELVVFLQATSPLRPENAISEAIDQIITSRADSLFSACPQHGFVWRSGAESLESLTYDYKHRPRRQDAPEDFAENGSIYVFKPWVLRELGNRLGGRVAIYRMRTVHSFQVDTPDDIELMETLVRVLRNSVGNPGVDS
jgi:N-acylneuraminate cytidylyltransferase